MLFEPFWIGEALAAQIHNEQLQAHGGGTGVRDFGLLQSALARAQHIYTYNNRADLCELAAAYGHGVAANHPFVDGNKRTAYVCMRTFLIANGVDITASDVEKYAAMISVASGEMDEANLADWLRENTAAIE